MIRVFAKSVIKDGKLDEAVRIYEDMLIGPTRAEKGCISYELCKDTKSNDTIAMVEQWADEDCFNAHLETPHYKEAVPKLKELTDDKQVFVFEKIR